MGNPVMYYKCSHVPNLCNGPRVVVILVDSNRRGSCPSRELPLWVVVQGLVVPGKLFCRVVVLSLGQLNR